MNIEKFLEHPPRHYPLSVAYSWWCPSGPAASAWTSTKRSGEATSGTAAALNEIWLQTRERNKQTNETVREEGRAALLLG